jgi:hypothetical protein
MATLRIAEGEAWWARQFLAKSLHSMTWKKVVTKKPL